MSRQVLRTLCRVLIGAVLWAQLAIAAYACPGLSPASLAEAMPCEDMAMPMGSALDQAFPNLCAAHCHQGQQSDQVPGLTVPAVLWVALYAMPPAPGPLVAPRPRAEAVHARAGAPPPHAILHCCFRI